MPPSTVTRARAAGLATVATVATLAIVAGLALASCSRENVHTASLLVDGADGGVLNGFDCVEDKQGPLASCIVSTCNDRCRSDRTGFGACLSACASDAGDGGARESCSTSENGPPLLERASGKPVCVVLDYVRVGGEIECRSTIGLLDWCLEPEHGMCPIVDRHAFPVRLPAVPADAGPDEVARALDTMYGAIHDAVTSQPVLASPSPDDWVIARLFASTQDCDTLTTSPDRIDVAQVVGCAFSCTVLLRDRTDIPLELDNGIVTCQPPAVQACAALGTTALPGVRAALQRPGP